MKPATVALHGGASDENERPFMEGPTFASAYHLSGNPEGTTYGYGRFANPTWHALEQTLGALEGGTTRVFPSGMSAISAVICSLLKPGDVLVLPSDGYFATRTFAHTYAARWGVEIREAPTAGDAQACVLDGATMLWLETPSNPHLDVCDIASLSDTAHASGTIVVVDNTTATPYLQTPLALGADISVASDTKAISGHSDVLGGHVSTNSPDIVEAITTWRTLSGAIPGPMESWLIHRGLSTLGVRVEQQQRTAQEIADMLNGRADVADVRYPGLAGDPSNAVATRQMNGFGTIIGFALPSIDAAQRFLNSTNLIYEATSFGGVHSTAERRGRWGTDDVPAGFIRLSVGCEDKDDLIDDFAQALNAAGA